MAEVTAETLVIRCPACGAENRVRRDRLEQGMQAVCARCKAPLPTEAGPAVVTDATFGDLVERSPIPVLVDFWAPWCGPCRMIAPTINELAAEMTGRARVAKLNIDENQATAARFRVASIPTLLVFKGGREVDRIIGLQSKAAIAGRLTRVLG